MECVVDFNGFRFNFAQNKYKQKIWIDVLLHFSQFDIAIIANILNLPNEKLKKVHQGVEFLHREPAQNLGKLFLLTFSNPGMITNHHQKNPTSLF